MNAPSFLFHTLVRAMACAAGGVLLACEVALDDGPFGVGDRPFVEGRWDIEARVDSSSCGFVRDEPFGARVFQNRDLLQFVVRVEDFGDVRYDGRLERDGDFFIDQVTVFPDLALRDESTVEGQFGSGGRRLVATEIERLQDLRTGERCSIVWHWVGDRR
ncbi:MAG: hypothetical protein ACREK5_08655 [Gemmatimonadota bacterium]